MIVYLIKKAFLLKKTNPATKELEKTGIEVHEKIIEQLRDESQNEIACEEFDRFSARLNYNVILFQIDSTRIMMSSNDTIDDTYNELFIQFGYIAMFSSYFPIIGLIAVIANIIHLISLAHAYSKYTKRGQSRRIQDIQIWNQLFEFISFVAILYNAILLIYPAGGFAEFWGSEDLLRDLQIVLACLMGILAARYMIVALISRTPSYITEMKAISKNLQLQANRPRKYFWSVDKTYLSQDVVLKPFPEHSSLPQSSSIQVPNHRRKKQRKTEINQSMLSRTSDAEEEEKHSGTGHLLETGQIFESLQDE